MEQTVQSIKQWTETKQERKARKAREKTGLSVDVESNVQLTHRQQDKKYIICLKWGNKYGPEYVNKMYSMVKRNCTLDYEFICFTEDRKGIDRNIRTEPLPELGLHGWWYKIWFLSNELPIKGTALFFDLDLIVFKNIDNLFTYRPEKEFVIIRDFNRQIRPSWDRMNSSVFRINIGKYDKQYKDFIAKKKEFTTRMQGDQDYMFKAINDHIFWPDEWIQSYKWEMRGRNELGIVNGKRNFKSPGVPNILPQTSIAVFHGNPNMHECIDPWCKENWN
jgi:hypothetical protein